MNAAQNLPSNDTIKSLSERDKVFFSEVKKLRSSLYHDPPVLTKIQRTSSSHLVATTSGANSAMTVNNPQEEEEEATLPQLHASAFLDPKYYCRISAEPNSTISGSDAVRRLIRGKRNLLETMREEIHLSEEKNKKRILNWQFYDVRGHGVPIQLFDHLLNASDTWLSELDNAFGISLQKNSSGTSFGRMLIHAQDGFNKRSTTVKPWPSEWENDMELYLTVLIRIATNLSGILQSVDGLSKPQLKHWNVDIRERDDNRFISQSGEEEAKSINPLIKFSTLEKGMGQISIHLKRKSNASGENKTTTMAFVGVFDIKSEGSL